jgi:hypothetical protein
MLTINPIPEEKVDIQSKIVYEDIKKTLDTNTVPVYFKYMANFPDFFNFAWDKIKPVIPSKYFRDSTTQLTKLSEDIIKLVYYPSPTLNHYINSLSENEKIELDKTIQDLSYLNAELMLISIAIRESLKGIVVLEQYVIGKGNNQTQDTKQNLLNQNSLPKNLDLGFELKYSNFYEIINQDMRDLAKSEKYLKGRVELERIAQMQIESFPKPLHFPFRETVSLLQKYPNFEEILFLLNSTFPSGYPHSLLTGSVMKSVIFPARNISTI